MQKSVVCALAALLLAVTIGARAAGARATPAFDAAAILKSRADKDAHYRDSPQSPFNRPTPVPFSPLKYFPPSPEWVFRSKLAVAKTLVPVTILDTKGRQRQGVIYGSLGFEKDGASYTLRVYRMTGPGGTHYYALWFTDRTTSDSTYDVGRYLDFEKSEDPEYVYTLDFNLAYNPYCAYSPAFGCAIPRKEDRLDLAVTAGEKKWHD